jgi:hypothetical protein
LSSRTKQISRLAFVAYKVSAGLFEIAPAPIARNWMDLTPDRYAYRCLPMVIANQAGWLISIGAEVRATWSGGKNLEDLHIETESRENSPLAESHFGSGIMTWHIPFLFRTPPGYNLLVRGPSNWPIDGASPLEGIVETDWAVATFTMNWKLTRPGHEVVFPKDFPVAMLVPQLRHELEKFDPLLCQIERDPELMEAYQSWGEDRKKFNTDLNDSTSNAARIQWQRHYFRGTSPSGAKASDHQLKLNLQPFRNELIRNIPPKT